MQGKTRSLGCELGNAGTGGTAICTPLGVTLQIQALKRKSLLITTTYPTILSNNLPHGWLQVGAAQKTFCSSVEASWEACMAGCAWTKFMTTQPV